MGKFRELFLFIAVVGAFIAASAQPAHAQARWRAYCASLDGTAFTVDGVGHCVGADGVLIF